MSSFGRLLPVVEKRATGLGSARSGHNTKVEQPKLGLTVDV